MSNLNITPDKWQYTTPLSVQYIKPRSDNAKLVIGQTPGTAVEGSFGTAAAVFSNNDDTGLGYFGNIGYGSTSFLPIGGVYISGHLGGTAASPTQTLNTWYLGGHAFFGIDAGGSITTSSAYHLLPGTYSIATSDAASGVMDSKYYIGGLLTPMISFNTLDNSIKFNESLFDSDINFYADTVTAMSIDGATGGISTVSTGAADGLSIDTTASTGNGLTVKAQTGYYNFQFKKSDGANLLYGQWDGGNFHHHLGGSLYYNIHTYNFVIDGNGNSNVGLIISNGAELKLDSSINNSAPNIRMGGGSYATAGVPLTTTNVYWNSAWGWNGTNGYTETSQTQLNHVMLSHTTGDSELRFINNASATVMKLGMLNKTMTVTGHSAFGSGATVDSVGAMTALSGQTLSTASVNMETMTNQALNINAAVFNGLVANPASTAGGTWIAQDGLVEIPSSNSQNFTSNALVAGDAGGLYHYGSGSIIQGNGVLGIIQNAGSGTITTSVGVRSVHLSIGTSTATAAYGLSSQLIHLSGTPTTTDYHGVHIYAPAIVSGTLTNAYGSYIESITAGGTVRVGTRIDAPSSGASTTTMTLWLSGNTDNTVERGGIVFGSSKDTNLYRSAANTLKTDDTMTIGADLDHDGSNVGLYNVAPVARATTGVAAATFVTNTSLIANDTATFDGYTIGQVVKALRNIGILT